MEGFINSNCIRDVLYVVKSSYQASTRLDMIINVMEIMVIKQVWDST